MKDNIVAHEIRRHPDRWRARGLLAPRDHFSRNTGTHRVGVLRARERKISA